MKKIMTENIMAIVKSFYYFYYHFTFVISIFENIQDSFTDNHFFFNAALNF